MIYSGYSCDNCGYTAKYNSPSNEWLPSKTHLIRYARKNGWSVGKQVLCPECRKKGRKP